MNPCKKPFILAIGGGSGSGKTTFARRLQEKLGAGKCRLLSQDSYYIDQSHRFDRDGGSVNFDHPDAIEFSLLAAHQNELKENQSVDVPIYDFATHKRLEETIVFEPAPIILVDGILVLSRANIREASDFLVFMECEEDLRFQRRLERDIRERGRTPDGVHAQFYGQVKPMHDEFVETSKHFADLTVSVETFDDQLESLFKKLFAIAYV